MADESGMWPDPVDGAPLTSRASAELALAVAAREVSDFARSIVPTGPDHAGYDGLLVADARRLMTLTARVLAAAVVVERADGTTWQHIADSAGTDLATAQQRWQPVIDSWETEVERAAASDTRDDIHEALADPATTLVELDSWTVRHREPDDLVTGDHPVTDAMRRMSPMRELLHLAAARRRLGSTHTGSAPPSKLLPLVDREAALHEHLAANADPADRADHTQAAARARILAAHLRARIGGSATA